MLWQTIYIFSQPPSQTHLQELVVENHTYIIYITWYICMNEKEVCGGEGGSLSTALAESLVCCSHFFQRIVQS